MSQPTKVMIITAILAIIGALVISSRADEPVDSSAQVELSQKLSEDDSDE